MSGIPNALVAAYDFDEGAGTTFSDGSGKGNHGFFFQATWAPGRYGTAVSFDGVNDYASVPDSASLDLTNNLTLQAWVRPTASSAWRTILLKETPNDLAYALYSASGVNRPSAWIASASSSGPAALPLNTWSHVAASYDGARLKLYVNGVLVADDPRTGSAPVSGNPLKLGGNAVWGEYFAGQIDDVRLYNTARTQTQIQTDMNRIP
jgi:hypothetical protein